MSSNPKCTCGHRRNHHDIRVASTACGICGCSGFENSREPKTIEAPEPSPAPAGDDLGKVKVRFGLAQQGHIPTIERMLDEHRPWSEIAKAIGWEEHGAMEWYIRYLRAAPASPPPVQAPAAAPLGWICPGCNGYNNLVCGTCSHVLEQGAGAPSAGRPMKLKTRTDEFTGRPKLRWLQVQAGDLGGFLQSMPAELAEEVRYRLDAFEGAGRPMTWMMESGEMVCPRCNGKGEHPFSDGSNSADGHGEWCATCAGKGKFKDRRTPLGEGSQPEPAPTCPDCDCSPCACLIDREEPGESAAPIREAKADPGQEEK